MIILLLIGILYGISVLVRYDQTKKQNAQIAHIKQVQAAAQEETKRQKAEAAAEYQRVVELEMEQVRQAKWAILLWCVCGLLQRADGKRQKCFSAVYLRQLRQRLFLRKF